MENLTMLFNIPPAYSGILFTILAAIFIMIFARKKTNRDFSFKVRSSLNVISGYCSLLLNGKAGTLTEDQVEYVSEIQFGALIITSILNRIETKKQSKPDKSMKFDMRTATMNIQGYSDLLKLTTPEITSEQLVYLNEILAASSEILRILK